MIDYNFRPVQVIIFGRNHFYFYILFEKNGIPNSNIVRPLFREPIHAHYKQRSNKIFVFAYASREVCNPPEVDCLYLKIH